MLAKLYLFYLYCIYKRKQVGKFERLMDPVGRLESAVETYFTRHCRKYLTQEDVMKEEFTTNAK